MLTLQRTSPNPAHNHHYSVSLARSSCEIDAAQRLRYRVFMEELGAIPDGDHAERDIDDFDIDCDHILVTDQAHHRVVGCYRIMRPETAARRGAFYADGEFDLRRLDPLRQRTAEVGRASIDPDYRNGTVLMLLWSALGRYIVESRYDFVIGCASISLADGDDNALAVFNELAAKHLSPSEFRVFPRIAYLPARPPVISQLPPKVPPLIKGYTRMGAWVCGAPAWDARFNTADLFVLLPLARLTKSYARHFFGQAMAA